MNAAVLAEIARLRAENAELRAANERLSPVAAPAPPPVQTSLDDLPPLVAAAPPSVHASMETSFDARDFAPPAEPDAAAAFDDYELPPSVRASAAASFEAPEYELPASMRASAAAASTPITKRRGLRARGAAVRRRRRPAAVGRRLVRRRRVRGPSSARASVEPAASVRESVEAPVEAAEPELELDVEDADLAPPAAARSPVAELSPEVRDLLARAPPTASLVSDLFESADPASPPLGKVRASTTSVASVVTPPAAAPAPENHRRRADGHAARGGRGPFDSRSRRSSGSSRPWRRPTPASTGPSRRSRPCG